MLEGLVEALQVTDAAFVLKIKSKAVGRLLLIFDRGPKLERGPQDSSHSFKGTSARTASGRQPYRHCSSRLTNMMLLNKREVTKRRSAVHPTTQISAGMAPAVS